MKVDRAVTREMTRTEQRRTEETRQRESDRIEAEFSGKLTEQVYAKITDPSLPITAEMAVVIKTASDGVDVARYIADHPEEGMRIASLPSHLQQYEMGRLSASLPTKTKPKPPPTPLTNLVQAVR